MTPSLRQSALLLSLALATGPLSNSHALLDKTRFVAHLGVAYYAFHHWVWSPYKSGQFTAGAAGRTSGMVKGGAALLFAAHEVSVAERVARNSHDPLLQKLDAKLAGLQGSFANVGNKLKNGQLSDSDLQSLNSATTDISAVSAAGGQPIKDVAAPIAGL